MFVVCTKIKLRSNEPFDKKNFISRKFLTQLHIPKTDYYSGAKFSIEIRMGIRISADAMLQRTWS